MNQAIVAISTATDTFAFGFQCFSWTNVLEQMLSLTVPGLKSFVAASLSALGSLYDPVAFIPPLASILFLCTLEHTTEPEI